MRQSCDATSLIGVCIACMKCEMHLSLLWLGGAVQAQVCVAVQVEEGLQHIQHLGHLGENEGLMPACLQLVQQLRQLLQCAIQVRQVLAVTRAASSCEAHSCEYPVFCHRGGDAGFASACLQLVQQLCQLLQ